MNTCEQHGSDTVLERSIKGDFTAAYPADEPAVSAMEEVADAFSPD